MARALKLATRLDSAQAQGLAADLCARRGKALQLDISPVETVSALALEVIIAAARQWALDGQDFGLTGRSARFAEACTRLGLAPQAPWQGAAALPQTTAFPQTTALSQTTALPQTTEEA